MILKQPLYSINKLKMNKNLHKKYYFKTILYNKDKKKIKMKKINLNIFIYEI